MKGWILLLLLYSSLFLSCQARRRKQILKEQSQVPEEKALVLFSGHFFSDKQKSTTCDLTEIRKDKPLLFLLRPADPQQTDQTLQKNPITVTCRVGSQPKQCSFSHFHALCSLPQTASDKISLKLQCKSTPCQIKWEVEQPQTLQQDSNHTLNHLVSVNRQKNHAILKVYCTDPAIRSQLDSKIEMHTNSQYHKVVNSEGEITYFFDNQEEGEYFIGTSDRAIESCSVASLEHAEDTIALKKEGFTMSDFFVNNKANIYELGKDMQTDIRIDFLLHDAKMQVLHNDTWVNLELVGVDGNQTTLLSTLTLDIDDEKEEISFDMIFKRPKAAHQNYQLRVKAFCSQYLIAAMRFVGDDLHEVEFTEESYFELKKGDSISYKLLPLASEQTNVQTVNIFVSDQSKFKLSTGSCPKTGCGFTVLAQADGQGYIYLGQDTHGLKAAEVAYLQFTGSIGGTLREGEQKFYLYRLKAQTAVQILVNTPNVLVYAANRATCSGEQLSKCHQKQVSYHAPSIYQAHADTDLVFLVRALDSAQFTLSVIDAHEPYIELRDTVPFVYLMDTREDRLTLSFNIREKTDVSFNLVAPLHELSFMVVNAAKLESSKEAAESEFSHEGFISFQKADLKHTAFTVLVTKTAQSKQRFVHFTLIASTKQSNLILEPSNPHYQKLPAKSSRDYLFAVYQNKRMFLNLYVPRSSHVQLKLTLSDVDQYDNASNSAEFAVNKSVQVIALQAVGRRLCHSKECQLFARLSSQMAEDSEVTLTLMVQNSIVELKEGSWQEYDLNRAATTSHFYFLPKHSNHSTTIFYHSSLVSLQVAYTLWKSDDTSIDISRWPFPLHFSKQPKQPSQLLKPAQFLHIDSEQLQKCWPYCVVLVSIVAAEQQLDLLQQPANALSPVTHTFRIMAADNLIQLFQKRKLDILLNTQEEKLLLVDLRSYMHNDNAIVFFTYFTLGSTQLKANLYTRQHPSCPTVEQIGADFTFSGIETEVEIQDIRKKLQQNKMGEEGPWLCILAHSYLQSKFSIQFVAEARDIKALDLDTTTPVNLKSDETRLFQIHAHFEFFLKLSRTSGFPQISSKLCNPAKDMEDCLQDFINSEQKGAQLVNKVMSLSESPCAGCMYYLKVAAKEETQLTIHAQSRFIEIQLKENTPLSDMLTANEVNKYLITSAAGKQLFVNIQISSGDLKVQLSDFGSVSVKKQNQKGSSNIHISVPPKDLRSNSSAEPTLNAFQFSNSFAHLHLTVQSQHPNLPANYILTYSNGHPTTYLEDGLIAHYNLISQQTSKFLYSNSAASAIYLHLSTPEAQSLNHLKVTLYSMQDPNDQDSKSEISVAKEAFQKKTANPTLFMHLPANAHYIIEVFNANDKDVLLYIGVNNRQIIYLPLDHEFPFRLDPKEYLYFVLSTASAGYLRFTLNKCDASQPFLAYTNNYNDFLAESFQTEQQVTDSLVYDSVIRVKKAGSLYFKVRAEDATSSMLTAKALFNADKISLNNAKAGNKGNLEYQFLDSETAEISYSGVVCDNHCGDFTYTAIRSNNVSNIIAKLVCTSVSFDLLGFTLTQQPEMVPLHPTSKDNKLQFTLPIKEDFNYIGVKAVNSKSGAIVYYQPLEITTLKGKFTKAVSRASEPHNLLWMVGVLIVFSVVAPLVAYRRYQKKRRAYKPVEDDEMQDSVN